MCEEGKQELSEGHQRHLPVPAHEEQLVLGQGTLHSVVVTVSREGMGRVNDGSEIGCQEARS